MALDGILLYKIVPEISKCLPCRIQKIYQIAQNEILFHLHSAQHGKQQLLISCHSQFNRMLLTQRSYPTPSEPGNFVMVLRKYLEGASLAEINQFELDRWCSFTIRRHNDLGDLETMHLYVELMGKYANVILVNNKGIIVDALKRIPPFENNRRTIHPGAEFKPTPSQNKKNPFKDFVIEEGKTLTQQFGGFSPFLSQEVEYRMNHGQSFESIMREISTSNSLFISSENSENNFHCIDLKTTAPCREYALFDGFDNLYFHKEEKERIKEISGDIYHIVKRELKHQSQKLPRLLKELDEAKDCARWNKYGELLYAYGIQDTKGQTSIELNDYETGAVIRIPLDPKLDGKGNARKCYSKYTKLKKGQVHLQGQIEICKSEINYFSGLIEQLDQADFATADEIKDELIRGGYLKEKKNNRRKKKKETSPKFTNITLSNGTVISFGRNNLQNDVITWHEAKKNEYWFHAKDYHGSHVLVRSFSPDEETIRAAAMIAAYYSAGRNSSSVPVNWCLVKELKKIPGAKPGMVQLGSYKTIYIDPEVSELEKLGIHLE